MKALIIAVVALCLAGAGYAIWPKDIDDHGTHGHVHLATCVGADPCKACTTCSSCKYCKDKTHTCGTCKDKKKK